MKQNRQTDTPKSTVRFKRNWQSVEPKFAKQALSFLRMLTKDASIILMDEPFSAVDKKSKEYFENYLFSKKEMNHKLLIFVTHDLGETLYQYDEVLLMREGKIIAHDKYERLREMSEYKSFHEQKV